jgi:hypothetical protein
MAEAFPLVQKLSKGRTNPAPSFCPARSASPLGLASFSFCPFSAVLIATASVSSSIYPRYFFTQLSAAVQPFSAAAFLPPGHILLQSQD